MDALPDAYAYRCLPLTIANAHGWELCAPQGFDAVWNGGPTKDDITIMPHGEGLMPTTHFGSGILTFHVGYLFKTAPGVSLIAQGPVNSPKDGIQPLTGVIETDWSPYTFTMNWLFTRAETKVRFEPEEPFCHIFPMVRTALEEVEPEIHPFESDVETLQEHKAWSASRNTFNADLLTPGTPARDQKWQKDYYRGYRPTGAEGPADHRTKLRLKPFVKTSVEQGDDENDQ